jgi:hypothetical protein
MAPIKFLTDEHVARAVIHGLRQRGIDVVTTAEAGLLQAPDDRLLSHARVEGRVMVTQDSDYLAMHSAGFDHAGIAFAQQGTPVRRILQGLILIQHVLSPDEMLRHVEYL